jgi:hypothetical protein
VTTPALADKGGGPAPAGTAGIALSSDPSFGSTVSFAVTYPAMKWTPEVSVTCTLNGQQVYLDAQTPSGSGTWAPQFTLWSLPWGATGGVPANCTAQLYYYTWQGKAETGVVYLSQTSFVTT